MHYRKPLFIVLFVFITLTQAFASGIESYYLDTPLGRQGINLPTLSMIFPTQQLEQIFISQLRIANQRSLMDIRQLRREDGELITNFQLIPTRPDGDCAFHALNSGRRHNAVSRARFIQDVRKAYSDSSQSASPLHTLIRNMIAADHVSDIDDWASSFSSSNVWLDHHHLEVFAYLYQVRVTVFQLNDSTNTFVQTELFNPDATEPIDIVHGNIDPRENENNLVNNHFSGLVMGDRNERGGYFAQYEGLEPSEYIQKLLPHLSSSDRQTTQKVLSLIKANKTPISEDNTAPSREILFSEKGQIDFESGYSYPPQANVQGVFLDRCLKNGLKKMTRVLDIGAGSGNDTIMALLTSRAQVVAIDIHRNQLQKLSDRLEKVLFKIFPDLKQPGHFAQLRRDFSNHTSEVPEKWKNKFDIVNLNKVAHFLNPAQIKTLIKNIDQLLSEDGTLHLTTLTVSPKDLEFAEFRRQKETDLTQLSAPGVIFKRHRRVVEYNGSIEKVLDEKIISAEEAQVPSLGQRRAFARESDIPNTFITTYITGRHLHDLTTLEPFLRPYFVIVDTTVYQVDSKETFLSIIAKKKK